MAGIGAGLGAAALAWEQDKQKDKELDAREIERVAELNNHMVFEDKMEKLEEDSGIDVYDEDHMLGKGFYNPYTKKYGNKAWRNNNPGNITGMGGKLLRGAKRIAHNKFGDKGDQRQQVFETEREGWSAMYGLMKDKYGEGPIRKSFSKWQSNQEAWKNMQGELVSRGVNIDRSFNSLSPEDKMILMNNRAQHEGWTGSKFNDPSIFTL